MHDTPLRRSWKRFKRNKLALIGLALIIVTTLAGMLGYLVMPDATPMANDMLLQLSIKKPGASFTLVRFPKTEPVPKASLWKKMLFGQPALSRMLPVTDYRFSRDSIVVREYIGDEERADETAFPLRALLLPSAYHDLQQLTGPARSQWLEHTCIVRRTYLLGTDLYGRDLLSRLVLGIRVSLSVGVMAVFISLAIGLFFGSLAGYYGGRTDTAISWLMNVIWSLPALLLVIAISFALGKGFWQIFIAVGLTMWVDVARLVRGQVMSLKTTGYIEAARALGYTNGRIILRHILPNIWGPVLVIASSNFASAILLEAGLSFLGFGAQPPMPTWGGMIKEHYGYIIMDAAYLAILPGLCIMLLVYAFNLVATGLRDAFDVKTQERNV